MLNAGDVSGLSQDDLKLMLESVGEELVFIRDTITAFGVDGFDRISFIARDPAHPFKAIMIIDDNVDDVIKVLQSLRRATTIETVSKRIAVSGSLNEIENICKVGVFEN